MIRKETHKGNIYALISGLCVTGYYVVNKYVFIHYRPDGLSYISTFMLCIGMLGLLSYLYSSNSGVQSRYTTHRNNKSLVAVGLLTSTGIAISNLGLKFTTATNASILSTFTIITTIAASQFMHKKSIEKSKQPWVLVQMLGIYISIAGFTVLDFHVGDIIVLMSCFLFGFHNSIAKDLLLKHQSSDVRDFRFMAGGLLFGFIIIFGKNISLETGLLHFALVAGLFHAIGLTYFYKAVSIIGPSRSIVLNMIAPVSTLVFGVLLLGEHLTVVKALGTVIVIGAIYFISSDDKTKRKT
jgi:drug/metabolite transporter (DMT)-like permease